MLNSTRFRFDSDIARQSALAARIARGQSDIAAGTRLQRASDDPAAAARIAVLRGQAIDNAAWRSTADAAAATAARVDGALGSVSTLLDRARELVTIASSDTLSAADRAGIATELATLADQVDDLAGERDIGGAALFPSGAASRLPVGRSLQVVASVSRDDAFDVATAGGTRDVSAILRDAATAMGGTSTDRASALADVAAASDHIAAVRGDQGGRAARIEAIRERLGDIAVTGEEQRSALEDTDIPATVARIQADQLSLDAARSLFARINRNTLFDLLG